MQYPDYAKPPSKRVVAGMPRQEALVWLRGVKSAIMGLEKASTGREKFKEAQQAIRLPLMGTLFVEEYILALDQYLDDPELCELAMFIAFSLVAEDGPFDGPVAIFGYRGLLKGPNAPTGINGRDHFAAQLKEMPEAEGILGRVAGAYWKKVKQRKKNLSLNKRLAAEACAIARAGGGFNLRECSETKPAKYRKPTAAAHMSAEEAHERHKDCAGLAERMYEEGTGIPARCFELAEANGLFYRPEL